MGKEKTDSSGQLYISFFFHIFNQTSDNEKRKKPCLIHLPKV